MIDSLTKEKRSWNMSRVRSRHTKPELIIRTLLHRSGFRFRINVSNLPGCPDITLPKYKTVIFVHGCFWHKHKNCSKSRIPDSNKHYWQEKLNKNVRRDKKIRKELEQLAWRVIVVWECEIMENPLSVLDHIVDKLSGGVYPKNPSEKMTRKKIMKIAEQKSRYYLDNKKRDK